MSELEQLRDQVEQLQAALGLNIELPNALGLPPLKMKIVGVLLKRDIVNRGMLLDLLYGGQATEPDAQTVDVHISQIKRRLSEHDIKIKNRYGVGWYFSAEDKAKLKTIIAVSLTPSQTGIEHEAVNP